MKKTNAIRLLENHNLPYQLVSYTYDPDNLDVAHLAAENGLELPLVYKTLVLKGDKTGPIVAVIPGDKSLNMKSAAKASGNRKVHLIPIKDLQGLTGYIRGGCSPVGMKKSYPVLIDKAAETLDTFYVNAGTRGMLMGVNPEQLRSICEGIFEDISS